MTLLQIVQTIPPDTAKLIDEILEFSSEIAQPLQLGDGKANRDQPAGWDRNKLLLTSTSEIKGLLFYLKNNNCRKASYYSDFTGSLVKAE